MTVIQSIPASEIVQVNPGVIGAGGTGLQLNGLFLTTSFRVPAGTVQSFPNYASVAAFFGSNTAEANLAAIYFLGPNNSAIKPGAIFFAQYPQSLPVPAYLQSGPVSGLSLAQLQALSGTLIVTIDGEVFTSSTINLASATSFSAAAALIQAGLAAIEATVTGSISVGNATTSNSIISGTPVGNVSGNISAATANVTASIATGPSPIAAVMAVTALADGKVYPGATISGGNVTSAVVVAQLNGAANGIGNYSINVAQTVGSETISLAYGNLTVSVLNSGTVTIGDGISAAGMTANSLITAQISGTPNGVGSYALNPSQTVANITAGIVAPAGNILTVANITAGAILPGAVLSGGGVAAGTTVTSQLTGTTGGNGTYQVTDSQYVSQAAIAAVSPNGLLNVTNVANGTLAIGQTINGVNVQPNTYIVSEGTGAGGTGTYVVNPSQTVAATTLTCGAALVSYDSQSGSFFIKGGQWGASGSIGYASGTLAPSINLTQATGAILSQGAALGSPISFMNTVVNQTQNWFSFQTVFDPVTADKVSFANWANSQDVEYLFINSSQDAALLAPNPTSTSIYQIIAAGYSGVLNIYDPNVKLNGPTIGAFCASWAASLDFEGAPGRSTLAFRSQSGLPAGVTTASAAQQLAANGCNFYGSYGTANANFVFLSNGSVTGPFLWADTYADAVWIKNALQLAMMTLLTTVGVIPYNSVGDGLIEAAAATPIQQFGAYGGYQPGVQLSPLQIAEVNASAGKNIGATLSTRGWYLSSNAAGTPANVRASRGSPVINFWYVDGQSIQQITIGSLVVQ